MQRLEATLRRIDGKGYPAYKDLRGSYEFPGFSLLIEHVQGDPFAAPSRIAVRVPASALPLEGRDRAVPTRVIGACDALSRRFGAAVRELSRTPRRGSGKSGLWGFATIGQELMPRTACTLEGDHVVVRCTLGLPAQGRRVLGREAWEMLSEELPELVRNGVLGVDVADLRAHADAAEDHAALQGVLAERGWVAFIADGAILPRRSGVDERPLSTASAVPWRSPPELAATVELPNAGRVAGSAIPDGVTVICGGGFHGKSTLLGALARCVYAHLPGDGRERCATRYEAVAVRAEDGRQVTGVDISAFIGVLPDGSDTRAFSTPNASGSTSQAANIIEAIELGARCLLIDEDTSATNFMVRDRRMQELVAAAREPITPFVDRVRALHDGLGVSTVLVAGGSGDFFDIADTVLVMDAYRPRVETARARAIAAAHPSARRVEPRGPLTAPAPRTPLPAGFDASGRGRPGRERARARETDTIELGAESIDIGFVEQCVDPGQARTIADWLLTCARGAVDGTTPFATLCARFEERGWSELAETTAPGFGDRVAVRRFELGAAINRLRSLRVGRRES